MIINVVAGFDFWPGFQSLNTCYVQFYFYSCGKRLYILQRNASSFFFFFSPEGNASSFVILVQKEGWLTFFGPS